MKKQMILVLLLAFAAFSNPIQAQEADNSLQREIDSLTTDIRKYDSEIKIRERKLKPINKVKNDCYKADSIIVNYRNKINEKRNAVDSIQSLLEKMKHPCDSLKLVNDNLENYKKQVDPLVSRQLSQMATTVDNTWLSKTYAETNMTNLSEELKLYEDFKDQDKGVAAAYKKLVSFSEDVMLYKQGVEIVNSPYDSDQIAAIMQPFENLVNKERHTGRKAESATVLSQLKGYSDCLKCFQKDIIEEIDKLLESYKRDGTSKKAWKQLKSFFDSADVTLAVQKLSQIPWLDKQYGLYVRQLEVDPYAFNPARKAVMELQP